ncbi:MAG: proton-translocating transhydrogenase family protein [Geminicoccaceae bacterium]
MAGVDPAIFNLIMFVLAVFVGSHAVSNASQASYKSLTTMISTLSGVIVVGALTAAGAGHLSFASIIGFFAVILATINIVAGFALTRRMLLIFKRQE